MDSKTSTDIDRTPVAKDIWCFSPKEKAFTWHVVINHDAKGYVDRVQCKVTGQVHKYKRQNKPEPVKSASTIVRRAAGSTATSSAAKTIETSAVLEETWFAGVKKWGDKIVPTYEPTKFFDKGFVVDHPSFGKGVVQTRRDNKIDVLFKIGIKTLPCARTQSA
ncbi:MAG: hypothetical protein ABIR96_09050 [Bdellovibrionota bacterium]